MEEVNLIVIGAGAIGLSIAYQLSGRFPELLVIEKEETFGRHTSSRNSEVIHSGIYYPNRSLKAELSVRGNHLLYSFLSTHKINHRKCGKIIVAVNKSEENALLKLKQNGERNQVSGMKILSSQQCKELEPQIKAVSGLYVHSTGILDSHQFMQSLERLIERRGSIIAYKLEVSKINYTDKGFDLYFTNGEHIRTRILINCAGIYADKVAQMAGINLFKNKLKLHLGKGQYYKSTRIKNIRHLIYPLPDPTGHFLGIHLTINLADEIRFGPNLFYTDNLDYHFDNSFKDEFQQAIQRYLPIDPRYLNPDDVGIRPKLQGPDDPVRDFYIREESNRGLPNFINLIGMESPGLTASLAIAEYVDRLIS
jgi:L-2-hydroxyglutarate oxidase LhgO